MNEALERSQSQANRSATVVFLERKVFTPSLPLQRLSLAADGGN